MQTYKDPTSSIHRYLRYAEGEGGEGGDGGGNEPPKSTESSGVSQDKVNELVGATRTDTRKATEERIAKELGVPINEAKELIAAARKQQDDQKSDAEKARDEATTARKEADAEKAEAAKERHEAKIERQLVRAGVSDDKLDRARRVLDVDADSDVEAVKKAVESLKSEEPTWFGTEAQEGGGKPPPAGGSDPKGKPPVKKKTDDAYARGAERAKASAGSNGYNLPGM